MEVNKDDVIVCFILYDRDLPTPNAFRISFARNVKSPISPKYILDHSLVLQIPTYGSIGDVASSNTRVILEAQLRFRLRAPRIWCPMSGILLPTLPIVAPPLGFPDGSAIRFVPDGICVFLAFHDLQTQSL